ncbi:Uncharacterized protein FWK35_00029581 [Aphis craccivora]|uniref:Uncharacterized protein n=1 Tax=Aphis craccivora TaxID=307492 RepID=A0A6G0YQ13_APHCR|nr:Uncharacterized protein FWK35_00029581 [Aphis craccivora]
MHILIASCLLIVCGIVDSTLYNQRGQLFNQLNQRRQRSIGFPYPYGYHYNPIEPSIDVLGSSSDAFDSQINSYKPIHQYVKMSTHDEDLVPRTYSYRPMNSIYDSEYTSAQNIPKLMPENIYDYKYIASPPINYQPQPLIPESEVAFNLFAIRKSSVFSYKSPNLNLNSNILSSIFVDPKSAETDSEISKVPSSSVIIVELLPEKLEHESTTATTEDPYEIKSYIEKVLTKKPFSVESESKYDAETPIENESNVLEENSSENQSYSITTEDELNAFTTEDEPNVVTTEDDSNYIPTEDESNSFTTEDESNSFTTEDESNSFTTEENQTEDEDSQTSTTQETTTVSGIDDVLNEDWFNTKSEEDSELKLKEIVDRYQKFRKQMKPLFTTTLDFKSEPSSSESDEKQVQTVPTDTILSGNEETETSAEYE